jgi:hypothetical protein
MNHAPEGASASLFEVLQQIPMAKARPGSHAIECQDRLFVRPGTSPTVQIEARRIIPTPKLSLLNHEPRKDVEGAKIRLPFWPDRNAWPVLRYDEEPK